MQYHIFVFTPRVNRALAIINDPERLNALSINQLINLKADLYNYTDISMDELLEALNSCKRKRLKEYSDMDYKEQKIFNGLKILNKTARNRMKIITNDFKNGRKTEKYEDIHNLSFVFRNNGYNFTNYPEITPMNSEVSWYKHMKAHPREKSFFDRFPVRTITAVQRVAKAAVLVGWGFIGNYFVNGDKSGNIASELDFKNPSMAKVIASKIGGKFQEKNYQATAQDFTNLKKFSKDWDAPGVVTFNHNKQNSNA